MNLLREYIRALLTEAAKGPADLPNDVVIAIKARGAMTTIHYGQKADPTKPVNMGGPNDWMGYIDLASNAKIQKGLGVGSCGGAWMISMVETASGWGPLLYDVAMEYATEAGGGLISDRGEVSSAARRVWNYYMQNRGDVTGIQLDDLKNTLTPEERDNCDQNVATYSTGYPSANTMDWTDSPLSKRWTKPPTMMNALRAAGKLVML